jgi:hypothetical protein
MILLPRNLGRLGWLVQQVKLRRSTSGSLSRLKGVIHREGSEQSVSFRSFYDSAADHPSSRQKSPRNLHEHFWFKQTNEMHDPKSPRRIREVDSLVLGSTLNLSSTI